MTCGSDAPSSQAPRNGVMKSGIACDVQVKDRWWFLLTGANLDLRM
jgi:hypothetical protein